MEWGPDNIRLRQDGRKSYLTLVEKREDIYIVLEILKTRMNRT